MAVHGKPAGAGLLLRLVDVGLVLLLRAVVVTRAYSPNQLCDAVGPVASGAEGCVFRASLRYEKAQQKQGGGAGAGGATIAAALKICNKPPVRAAGAGSNVSAGAWQPKARSGYNLDRYSSVQRAHFFFF